MKKGLVGLVTVLFMIIMLATCAFAADIVTIYTGSKTPLESGDVAETTKEFNIPVNPNTGNGVLNWSDILESFDLRDRDIVGWKAWEQSSGVLVSATAEFGVQEEVNISELEGKIIEPIFEMHDIVRFFHVVKYLGPLSENLSAGDNINGLIYTFDRHSFTTQDDLDLAGWPAQYAKLPQGYEITGWKLWDMKGMNGGTYYTLSGTPTEYLKDGSVSYEDIKNAEGQDILLVPSAEKKYWITGQPKSSNPTLSTNADKTDANIEYYWYKTREKSETISPTSGRCVAAEAESYSDGKWYVGEGQGGMAEPVNVIAMNEGENLTVKFGGDTNVAAALITTTSYDFESGEIIDGAIPNQNIVAVSDNKATYNTNFGVAVEIQPIYVDGITAEVLTTTANDYIEFEIIDLTSVPRIPDENGKTLSDKSLVAGYSYFVEAKIDGEYTLTSDIFHLAYEITRHPTARAPYVETNNDNDVISYTWYEAGDIDIPLNDETEYKLSTGEDGKEYYCVVKFNGEIELISNIFKWGERKSSGGGLPAGGDLSRPEQKPAQPTTPQAPSNGQESNKLFDDVPAGAWFESAVEWMGQKGYMSGTALRTFSPNLNTTRGMVVTVLWRMAGSPAHTGECPFEDVKADSYYEDAITWAQENGVVTGQSDTIFKPDDLITREQLATMIFRNEVRKGMESLTMEENLTHFEDEDKISEYAVAAMNWAVGQGIISGISETTLAPQRYATRAEFATMLYRMENK